MDYNFTFHGTNYRAQSSHACSNSHSRSSNFSNSCPIVPDRIRAITKKDFKCYKVDTTDKQALEVVFVAMCYAKTPRRGFSLGGILLQKREKNYTVQDVIIQLKEGKIKKIY